jgi:hypothetical protein
MRKFTANEPVASKTNPATIGATNASPPSAIEIQTMAMFGLVVKAAQEATEAVIEQMKQTNGNKAQQANKASDSGTHGKRV